MCSADMLKRKRFSAHGEHDRAKLKSDWSALFFACNQDIPLSIFVAVEWRSLQLNMLFLSSDVPLQSKSKAARPCLQPHPRSTCSPAHACAAVEVCGG